MRSKLLTVAFMDSLDPLGPSITCLFWGIPSPESFSQSPLSLFWVYAPFLERSFSPNSNKIQGIPLHKKNYHDINL